MHLRCQVMKRDDQKLSDVARAERSDAHLALVLFEAMIVVMLEREVLDNSEIDEIFDTAIDFYQTNGSTLTENQRERILGKLSRMQVAGNGAEGHGQEWKK